MPTPHYTRPSRRRVPAALFAFALGLVVVAGCTFDGGGLESRQCRTEADCTGDGESCLQGFCQLASCRVDADCDDALYCNGEETCDPRSGSADARGCLTGAPPAGLDDNIACTEDVCNEETNTVQHIETAACACETSADCLAMLDDAACKRAECVGAICAFSNAPVGTACAPAASCVTDTACSPSGECIGTPNHARCDDDLFCDGVEMCAPNNPNADDDGCVAGPAPMADDDGIACTDSVCDEASQSVAQAPTDRCGCDAPGEPCNDPDPNDCVVFTCSLAFSCEPRSKPANTTCNDGFTCTSGDACDASGHCLGTTDDAVCHNDLFCDGQELCDPTHASANATTGCIPGTPPSESDGLPCTDDICDEDTDSFRFEPTAACACNVDADCMAATPNPCLAYACVNAQCSITSMPANTACDDGLSCTTNDVCDDAGRCGGAPDDDVCNDLAWCNGVETCRPTHPQRDAQGCRPGTPQPQSDGVACTTDACLECDDIQEPTCVQGLSGRITHIPNGCDCTNDDDCIAQIGQPCISATCNLQTFQCTPVPLAMGAACEDGISCTTGSTCDANQSCTGGVTNSALCQDTSFCNGAEVCSRTLDCQPGEDPLDIYRRDHPDLSACIELACNEASDTVREIPGMCECAVDADCASSCSATATCNGGVCAVTWKAEGAACNRICANNSLPVPGQCFDNDCRVVPEGPTGSAACADIIDNDCDGLVDTSDADCHEPTDLTVAAPATATVGFAEAGAAITVTPNDGQGVVTGQDRNLYCVGKPLVHDLSATNGDWLTTATDAGFEVQTFGGNMAAANVRRGVRFDDTDPTSPLGVKVCSGYGVEIGPIPAGFPEGGGTYEVAIEMANAPQQSLGAGVYLLASLKSTTLTGFTPLVAVGNGTDRTLRTFELLHYGNQANIVLRFEVLATSGNANNQCGFVRAVRLYRTTRSTLVDTQFTRPQWFVDGADVPSSEGFNSRTAVFFDTFFDTDPAADHQTGLPATGGDRNSRAAEWRSHAPANEATARAAWLELPPPSAAPANLAELRTWPLAFYFHAELNASAAFGAHDLAHAEYTANGVDYHRLASVLPFNGLPAAYANTNSKWALILPEEAKTLAATRLRFSNTGLTNQSARLTLDSLYFFFSNLDQAFVRSTTLPSWDGTRQHAVTVKANEAGRHEIRCYWQVLGDPAFPTVASEPVFVSFQ